jgi:carbonic anhydrase
MITAREALERLRQGNRRFVANRGGASVTRPNEVAAGQHPFAIILGCSDSRVPAEIVFDQGLGDLFVIRVAGNIVAPSLVGSVEFAAERFGTRLVVVLGHSNCGAILATIEQLIRPRHGSSLLEQLIESDGLLVVGAEYSLETGVVDFFDGQP